MNTIGKQIRDILRKKEISLYRVAKDLGIAKESLHRSLMDASNPEWNTIKKIADYIDYEVKLIKKKRV